MRSKSLKARIINTVPIKIVLCSIFFYPMLPGQYGLQVSLKLAKTQISQLKGRVDNSRNFKREKGRHIKGTEV